MPLDTPSQPPKDALVLFMPSGRRGRFAIGTPVLDAARSLGVFVESDCGGRGICGRCQVVPAQGQFAKHGIDSRLENLTAVNEVEQRYAALRPLPVDRRLSCQARIAGDVVIDVPADVAINAQVVRKRSEARAIERDIAIGLYPVRLDPPDMDKPLGDTDRLIARLVAEHGLPRPVCDISLLPRIQSILRKANFDVVAVVHHDGEGPPLLLDVRPAGSSARLFGVACDIGSTTIACHLVDLGSGRTVASAGTSNPQIRFGEDLMSRVSYVMMNPDGREALTTAVRGAVDALIDRVAGQGGIVRTDILEAVFVGNPIMHHLFLGHRSDPARPGAVRARRLRRAAARAPAISGCTCIRRRASTFRPASPATSAPMPPASRCPRGRSNTPRRRWWSMSAPTPRSCSAIATASSRPPRRPARPSRAPRYRPASGRRPARSSASGSIPRRSSRESR